MNRAWREYFDEQLEIVLPELPERVRNLLDEYPLVVEDYPSPKLVKELGLEHRADLQGLHTGLALTERSIEHSGIPTNIVQIFREGILDLAANEAGDVDDAELRRQIRITILHEFGHLHGLDEDDLRELGYD